MLIPEDLQINSLKEFMLSCKRQTLIVSRVQYGGIGAVKKMHKNYLGGLKLGPTKSSFETQEVFQTQEVKLESV